MRLEIEPRRFYLGRDYSEAIEGLGGTPSHISLIPKREYIRECLQNYDGILLPGSDTDVDPLRFGEEPLPRLGNIIFEKDETEVLVLEAAEKLNLPILAICYGMQALNVFRGGTLFQDIESQISDCLRHRQGIPLNRNSHSIEILEDSRMARLITTKNDSIRVTSHHHQAVKKVGNGLRATAWAKDKVIECIEDTSTERFILGVQWHPELNWQTDQLSRNIFETFIEECK